MSSIDDTICKENANRDTELISSNQRPTHFLWRNLGHVKNDCSHCVSTVNTQQKSASEDLLIAEMNPTPAPAMRRPTTIVARVVDAVSRMHPTVNVKQPEMIVHRRPIRSATSPAIKAPKKVPQERIPVRRDCCHPGRTKRALAALSPVAGYGR